MTSTPSIPTDRRRASRAGFTLVEVLMVIMIIGVLTGLVLGVAGYANKKSAISKTEALHQQLLFGLENYKAEWGAYPQKLETILKVSEDGHGPYVEMRAIDLSLSGSGVPTAVKDAWGNPFAYKNPGTENPDSIDLYSNGPDLRPNTADDISNY